MPTRRFVAAAAVALGAFAAHGLKARLAPELLSAFQTGVQYHFYHALGLLAVAFNDMTAALRHARDTEREAERLHRPAPPRSVVDPRVP